MPVASTTAVQVYCCCLLYTTGSLHPSSSLRLNQIQAYIAADWPQAGFAAVTAVETMAIDKQQLHVQAYSLFTEPSIQSTASLDSKPSLSSSSPELDSAPGTPVRVSSSGKAFAALTPQSSQEEVFSDELRAALQPFHVAASPPSVMVQQQEAEQQRAAAKQTAAVMIACLTWVVISSATILINKHIMVDLS